MSAIRRTLRYPVSPLEAIVLLHHVIHSEDAENDADRTVMEIIAEIDSFDGYLSKGVLESALYCCNIENEKKEFWHPLNFSFEKFLKGIVPKKQKFNSYYNVLLEDKDGQVD